MHVGLLIYGSLTTVSGGFIYDRNLVRYLREAGDRVDVISLPWRHYGLSLLDNLNAGLRRRLTQAAFDVLLEDELVHPSCFWLNQRLRPRLSYPVVAIVHHLRCRERHPALMRRLYRGVEKRYLASVDGCICVSRTTAKDVEDVVGRAPPLVVAPPGRDGLPGAVSREAIMARATAPGPFNLIFVGNLIPRKELHTLLAALASLPQDDWRLAVAGSLNMDAAYVAAIRGQIKDAGLAPRVTLLGALPARELAARCAASHLLTVPSSYEGFGIVYLEGMQFGLPAIAGTAGAAQEIITHGDNGFLVPPGNPEALAHHIELLIRDREVLLKMSLAAHGAAAVHPTWNDSAAGARAFLQNFLR
ncbi:MAG: glycosyltransferase family 4 protein [Desulfobacterales bacterium]|nr:glycosyltransferase family 4 protein [Pseudomonadota bacterium]MBU4355366.1 glycosyltransferase family 4 protein [Pseudomonadota bacterium]MCG2771074.1 glycosyltransferase family 4 protein [Desulfobacterales bacterium]